MFAREQLIAELPRLMAAPSPPLETVEFGHRDFTSPCSEQSIEAYRGSKQDFATGLYFWVKALQTHDWTGREAAFVPYAQAGLCRPLSGPEFVRLVIEYSGSLVTPIPPFLTDSGGIKSGLGMYADWNDIAAVAETAEAFVAFFWSTTA